MNIEELSNQKMEAIRELANVSMQISDGKNSLAQLKSDIDTFLNERKSQEKEAILTIWEESKELVNSIDKNFKSLIGFSNEVKTEVSFIQEMQLNVSELIKEFNETSKEFTEWVKKEDEKMASKLKDIENLEKERNEELRKIKEEWKEIEKAKKQIESDKGLIKRTIERLQKGKI